MYFKLIEAYGKLIDGLHLKKLKYSGYLMLIIFILIHFKLRSCSVLILCIYFHDLVILEVAAHVNLMQVCVWKFQKVRLQLTVFAYLLFAVLFICLNFEVEKNIFKSYHGEISEPSQHLTTMHYLTFASSLYTNMSQS